LNVDNRFDTINVYDGEVFMGDEKFSYKDEPQVSSLWTVSA
jgi:hypothetical protein